MKPKDWNPITGKGWPRQIREMVTFMWLNDAVDATAAEMERLGLTQAILQYGVPAGVASNVGLGVQTYPDSATALDKMLKNRLAQTTYAKPWDALSPKQQESIGKTHEKELAASQKAIDLAGQDRDQRNAGMRAKQEAIEAGRHVYSRLTAPVQQALEAHGMKDLQVGRKADGWWMNDARYAEFQDILVLRLNERLAQKASGPRWDQSDDIKRKEILEDALDWARDKASTQITKAANRGER
jgi:hypothetical protein